MIRLAYDIRTRAGCDKPLVPAGYVDTPFTDKLGAKVGPRGLVEMHFEGGPTPLPIGVCLYPGDPTKPCAGGVASYPINVIVHAIVKVSLKGTKEAHPGDPRRVAPAARPRSAPAPRLLARPDVRTRPAHQRPRRSQRVRDPRTAGARAHPLRQGTRL